MNVRDQLIFWVGYAFLFVYLAWRVRRLEQEVKALRRWQPKKDSTRLSLYHRQKLRDAARSLEAFIGEAEGADDPDPGLSSPLEKTKPLEKPTSPSSSPIYYGDELGRWRG